MTPAQAARARARHVAQTGRLDLAEPELRRALALDPEDAELHAVLSIVLSKTGRPGEGLEEAEAAVALDPEYDWAHYARAGALLELGRHQEGTEAALEAVRLNPQGADVRFRLAMAWFLRRDLDRALREVDHALELDPEHAHSLDLRASIVNRQGRPREATDLVEAALALEPENARFHANRGWILLETGREREAQEAFREALRLRPGDEWAREGVLEAMKARNVAYRWLMRFENRLRRVPVVRRLALLLVGLGLALTFRPFFGVYFGVLFVILVREPLYNVALLVDPFGRRVLTRDEKAGAAAVAGCLWSGTLIGVWGLETEHSVVAVAGAVLGSMSLPVAVVVQMPAGSRRRVSVAAAAVGAVGVAVVAFTAAGAPVAKVFGVLYVLGLLIAALVATAIKR